MKAIKGVQYMLLLGGLMFATAACEEEEPINHAPTIVTGQATDVYRKGAFLSGSIQNPNGAAIKEYGIMISEFESMAEPTEYKMTNSQNVASFTLEAFGLTPKKEYFYCAYASSGASTVKGQVESFTTPESNAPVFGEVELSNLGAQSVTVASPIQDNGGSDILIHGFCWKQLEKGANDPTVADNIVNVEVGSEMITATVSGLMPEKEYLIRPYGVNSTGLGYGRTVRFLTQAASVPIMSWITSTDSTETSLSLQAAIGEKGRSPLTRFGFCWSVESQDPTVEDAHCELTELLVDSLLQYTMEEMSPLTTYYIRAYAENEHGVGYSDVLTFTTKKAISLIGKEPTDITSHSVLLQTEVDCDSETVPQQVGYCVSFEQNEDMTLDNTVFLVYGTWNGKLIESKVDGLGYETQYFVRAFWINQSGKVSYGEMQSFTTGPQGIYNLEDLKAYRDSYESYFGGSQNHWKNERNEINLYADIHLGGELWVPIFEIAEGEVFNGNGHAITGLYIDGSVKKYGNCEFDKANGFIRSNSGIIKDLRINGNIKIDDANPGGASGICCINKGKILGCEFSGQMSVDLSNNINAYVYAGITQELCADGVVADCVNRGQISYRGSNSGGYIYGIAYAHYDDSEFWASNAIIENCVNYGSLYFRVTGRAGEYVAGIGEAPTISGCQNRGLIHSSYGGAAGITTGLNSVESIVDRCSNYAPIMGGAELTDSTLQIYTGGIAAKALYGTLSSCYNEGHVRCNVGEFAYTGGIVGWLGNGATYELNTNYGTVNGEPGTEANAIGYDARNE